MTKSDFLKVLRRNVATIKTALAADNPGYVYVWPEYWLGVKFNKDDCRAVAIDLATIEPARGCHARVFRNGHGVKAISMSRREALRGALFHAVEMLERFEANEMAE